MVQGQGQEEQRRIQDTIDKYERLNEISDEDVEIEKEELKAEIGEEEEEVETEERVVEATVELIRNTEEEECGKVWQSLAKWGKVWQSEAESCHNAAEFGIVQLNFGILA